MIYRFLIFTVFSFHIIFSQTRDFLLPYEGKINDKELIGFKTKTGKVVITPQYQATVTDTMFNIAMVLKDNKWIVINCKNEILLYPYIIDNGPDYYSEGLFRFVENNKIGFADSVGNKIIKAEFDFAKPFNNGLAEYFNGGYREFDKKNEHSFWKGSKEKGFVNKNGQKFKKVIKLKNGRYKAYNFLNQQVILNSKGEMIK